MASRKTATAKADWRTVFRQSIARSLVIAAAAALGLFTLFLALALITYHSTDPSLNDASGSTANLKGRPGASLVELGFLIAGLPIALVLPLLAIMSWRLWTANPQPYWKRQLAYCVAGIRSEKGPG